MSRFFHAGDSDSSSSDEEEYDINPEEEQSEEETSDESSEEDSDADSDSSDSDDGKTGANRFLREASDSDDSDDEEKVTVVKSAKDKRFDELEATIKLMDNAGRISDWSVINEQYDKMNRQVPVLMRQLDGKPPKPFVKAIAELERAKAAMAQGEEGSAALGEFFTQARDARAEWATQTGKAGALVQNTEMDLIKEGFGDQMGRMLLGDAL